MTGSGDRRPVIAIDGAAGSGKSTLARRLAVELRLPYVNTGLMYREITRCALQAGVDVDDASRLTELAREIRFDLDSRDSSPSLLIDGRAPSEDLSTPEVEGNVSAVSRHPEVRAVMVSEQRRLASDGAVMEGRDIGSVVFPDADVKLFLEAEHEERASRRIRERKGESVVATELANRDARDARVNPFVPAPGAVRLDTTGKTVDETFREALELVTSVIGERRE